MKLVALSAVLMVACTANRPAPTVAYDPPPAPASVPDPPALTLVPDVTVEDTVQPLVKDEIPATNGWYVPSLFDSVYAHYTRAKTALDSAQGHVDMALTFLDSIGEDNLGAELAQNREELVEELSPLVLALSMIQRQTASPGRDDEIQLVVNEDVEYEIRSFQRRERKWFIRSFRRSSKFMPIIRDVFKDHEIPAMMAWLPFIESGYSQEARSHAGALGMWQFIQSTGHRFGLARDNYVEERMHVRRSTEAAIGFLTYLHEMFGDWMTALAAYNCGEGRVMRTIRRQRIAYLDNFWDLYRQLPRETARYVPRFIAVQLILNEPAKYGFHELLSGEGQLPPEEIEITRSISLRTIAAEFPHITEDDLASLNPDLVSRVTPPRKYQLLVPQGTTTRLTEVLSRLATETLPPQPPTLVHRVRRGETLSLIAGRYRTTVNAIRRENRIRNPNRLRVGQRLRVPTGRGYRAPSTSARTRAARARATATHVVQKGETLWSISLLYGMSLTELRRANNMRSRASAIQPGQRLRVRPRGTS